MAKLTFDREAKPLPKSALTVGSYYVGVSRNANVARWDGEKFLHWREKWGKHFIDVIKHREDDTVFDVFDAWMRVGNERQVTAIPMEEKNHDESGKTA